jgi:cell pole-organizing protein PopZ
MTGSEVPAADDVTFATVEETHVHTEEPAVAGDELISDSARRALTKAFEPYDSKPEPQATSMPSVDGGHLEAVFMRAVSQSFDPVLRDWMGKNAQTVVSHMKPLIREWMDENLPDLIERAVKSEMAAAVRALTKKR